MNKFMMVLATTLMVNTFAFAAPDSKKLDSKKAPVTSKQSAAIEKTVAPAVPQPQVNPQPALTPKASNTTNLSDSNTAPTVSENASANNSVSVAVPSTQDQITGTVDLRPSFKTKVGEVHSENAVDLGYKTGDWHFLYEQDFNTNVFNPEPSTDTSGLNFEIRDGLFRFKRANLWESDDKVYSLHYELRPYLPTHAVKRDQGMITAVRNYAKFNAKVSDVLTLSIYEIPIIHLYSRAGNTDSKGISTGNPVFENRVYLLADWKISEKLSFLFPLNLNSTNTREFNGVVANWGHYVWTQPELMYAVTKNYSVGLSWYNNPSFMKPDLSGFQISDALQDSVTQVVLQATL